MLIQKGKIRINNLLIDCIIGIEAEERKKEQKVLVSAEIEVDFGKLSKDKNADNSVDWNVLSQKIEQRLKVEKYYLAETAALKIAQMILEDPAALGAKVSVKKKVGLSGRLDNFEAVIELKE
jgi:D-erythro-7,8-dihydroneopterin triphosphate epimerase